MKDKELKDFILQDDVINEKLIKEENILASTDDLDNFDFSSEKEFDIEQYHELVSHMKINSQDDSMKEFIKLQEAKNIIIETSKLYLNEKFVDEYKKEEENLLNMIRKFDPNKDFVKNMSEQQKDKVYEIAQYLFNSFQKKLNNLEFHFPLEDSEMKLVLNVFKNKLEYDQNEVFQLKELKTKYLDVDFKKDVNKDKVSIHNTFINVNDLIVFYHLFSKYKIKGINSEYYDFINILTKIGERIKLFNAYNVIVQRLSNDFQIWGGSLSTDGDVIGSKVLNPSEVKIDSEKMKQGDISIINENSEVVK